ncbi:carbohydrate kinase family protein [Tropicimonas sp. TH_r6]|uniref:carbohydrate kinase family protein n=1 Tax=Tropicimonas sp. TH_r6 TaxID=3082085 RepID=UPI0029551F31|nr:carbohydrate kinase family protein [Tropicimonas sp. TH_r6]MDV7144014.1 carbohydrate kinase family protein [Tropicimonas sp. TH_r6]
MTDKPVVLCVGRLYCDLIFTDLPRMPTMGTEIYAGGFGVHAGGGAFITAAHLAALGHGSALSAMLPPQPFVEIVSDDLQKAGIDLQLCRTSQAGHDPQVTVALVGQGDRAFVTRRTGPACPPLQASDLLGIGATHVHIGELATLIERPDLVDIARSAGATISLDCSWDDSLAAAEIADALAKVDLFLPNDTEMKHLLEIGVPQSQFPLTVIKQGAAGSTAVLGGERIHEPAESVRVVDTTGAGDAFNAGFMSAWLANETLRACLVFGNAQGAKAVSQRGGYHGPSAA